VTLLGNLGSLKVSIFTVLINFFSNLSSIIFHPYTAKTPPHTHLLFFWIHQCPRQRKSVELDGNPEDILVTEPVPAVIKNIIITLYTQY